MAVYNMTNVTNANNLLEIYSSLNALSSGILSPLLLFALWLTIFISLKSYDTRSVMLVDSFIVTIIGALLFIAGELKFAYLLVPVVLLMGSLFYHVFAE